ncbi:hypothetical protein C3488_39460, partial [Streptomyces sp. Ru72]
MGRAVGSGAVGAVVVAAVADGAVGMTGGGPNVPIGGETVPGAGGAGGGGVPPWFGAPGRAWAGPDVALMKATCSGTACRANGATVRPGGVGPDAA